MEEIFTHTPLEYPWQIRLLELQPQKPENEHIRCRIWVVPGGDAKELDPQYDTKEDRKRIPYRALSYTWGERTDTVPIMIDNKLHYVRTNLFTFFNQMTPQEGSESEFFWIDAICINQDDVPERNKQVHRMTSIYLNAKRVDIWLGSAADDSDIALSQLEFLSKRVGEIDKNLEDRISRWSEDDSWTPFGPDKDLELRISNAISKLLQRPWWRRVWVIQEATVPGQDIWLMCGDCTILLSHFYTGLLTLLLLSVHRTEYGMLKYTSSYALNLWVFQGNRVVGEKSLDFVNLLQGFRGCLATDDRDRIYATLGMAAVDRTSFPSPDYGKSVEQVYEDVVQYFVATSPYCRKLDILGYADDYGLPRADQFFKWFHDILQDLLLIDHNDRSTINTWINDKFPQQLLVQHLAEMKQEILKIFIPFESSLPGYEELFMRILESFGDLEALDLDALRGEMSDYIHENSAWLIKFANVIDTFSRTQKLGPLLTLLEERLEGDLGALNRSDEATEWPKRVSRLQSLLPVNHLQAEGTEDRTFQSQEAEKSNAREWPSWLPDWRHEYLALSPFEKAMEPPPRWFGTSGEPQPVYSASGRDSEVFQIHDQSQIVKFDGNKLKLRGFRVDCIQDLRRLNLNTKITSQIPQSPKERLEPAIPHDIGQTYVTGEPISQAFWRTVTADLKFDQASTFSRQKPPVKTKPTSSYLNILRSITSSITSTTSKIFRTEQGVSDKKFDPCNGRQLAITEDKLMALVPRSAQLGDEIWVLGGGQVFYVLREHRKFFKLVGECYLHGFMDGEALERLNDGSAKVQNVTIM